MYRLCWKQGDTGFSPLSSSVKHVILLHCVCCTRCAFNLTKCSHDTRIDGVFFGKRRHKDQTYQHSSIDWHIAAPCLYPSHHRDRFLTLHTLSHLCTAGRKGLTATVSPREDAGNGQCHWLLTILAFPHVISCSHVHCNLWIKNSNASYIPYFAEHRGHVMLLALHSGIGKPVIWCCISLLTSVFCCQKTQPEKFDHGLLICSTAVHSCAVGSVILMFKSEGRRLGATQLVIFQYSHRASFYCEWNH